MGKLPDHLKTSFFNTKVMKIQQLLLDAGIGMPLEDPPKEEKNKRKPQIIYILTMMVLLLVWYLGPRLLQMLDATAGSVDQSIWLLIVFAAISFLIMVNLSWWLFKYTWNKLGFPSIQFIISLFDLLSPWQQLSFSLASFALVLLAALGSLNAVL
jgi:hypothetical protein